MQLVEELKNQLMQRNIPYKENQQNLIIRCPICYFRDGKDKIKLYIHKETGVFHCFRCNVKGNLIKLVKLLNKYYSIDLTYLIDLNTLLYSSFNTQYLSDTLSSIDRDSVVELISRIKKSNKTLLEVYNATSIENTEIINKVYGYLLKRGIPVTLLSHLPYFIGTNPQSRLFYRFGVSSFFYTNYEARTILKSEKLRYVQSQNKCCEHDFIFLPELIHVNTPLFSQKEIYMNSLLYSNKEIQFDELYIVEGVFDALKLNLYLGKPVISLGGWSKYRSVLMFIATISKLFKKFNINKLIVLFDKDVKESEMFKVMDTYTCYKRYIPVETINAVKFNVSPKYKDVGDVKSPEELKQLLKQLIP